MTPPRAEGAAKRSWRRFAIACAVLVSSTGLVVATSAPAPAAFATAPQLLPAPVAPARAAAPGPGPNDVDPDHLFVRFRSRPANLTARLAAAGAQVDDVAAGGWTVLETPDGADAARVALERDSSVAEVVPSYVRRATTVPNDPLWSAEQRDYLGPLRVDRAHDRTKGGGVVVAVIDTGVDLSHPDLAGRLVTGYDATAPSTPPQDDHGHGTMVAGIIAANRGNNRGGIGVAPSAKIMPVKVLTSSGSGSDTDIIEGIEWAADHGADVINLSLGLPEQSDALDDAIEYAVVTKDVVVVAAAGNDFLETLSWPAASPGALAISATTHSGQLANFSTYGWQVDLAAPGADITSTTDGHGYATGSGTSFSSPIVAGVAALVRAKYPSFDEADVVDRLLTTARDVGPPGVDRAFGHGIVDPLGAVGGTRAAPHPSPKAASDEPDLVDAGASPTTLTVGTTRTTSISPELDEDWYQVAIPSAGGYTVHIGSSSSGQHSLLPLIEVYDANRKFLASQVFSGEDDLAVEIDTPGTYLVRMRNENGSRVNYSIRVNSDGASVARFASPLEILGTKADSVGIADVTDDGRNDIVLLFGSTSFIANTLWVFAQTPARSFEFDAFVETAATAGGGMAVGDLNGDNKADVGVPTAAGVQVFLQSDATISDTGSFTLSTPSVPTQLAIGPVNGTGATDLVGGGAFGIKVWTAPLTSGSVSASVTATAASQSIAIGDVNDDTRADVVTCCVNVYTQNGGGAFVDESPTAITNAGKVAVGDFNGDTNDDFATAINAAPGELAVFRDLGGGSFAHTDTTFTFSNPDPLAVGDIDDDGLDDAVVLDTANALGAVLFGQADLTQALAVEEIFGTGDHSTDYDAKALAVGDLNSDGAADLAIAGDDSIAVLFQNETPSPLNETWVRDASPAPFASGVGATVSPTLTLGRTATAVNSTKVQLYDSDGDEVPAVVSYSAPTITINPAADLAPGPYVIRVDDLDDGGDDPLVGFSSSFTVGAAPDTTAPATKITAAPSGTKPTATATIRFAGASKFECSLDNAPFKACSSPKRLTVAQGSHTFRVFARDSARNEDATPAHATWTYRKPPAGYWMLGGSGSTYKFGTVPNFGNAPTSTAVDFEPSASGFGYWIVDGAGRVFAFGDAKRYGNAGSLAAGERVGSMSRTKSGKGYWLFTTRGRVFAFGDAKFYGDMRAVPLNGPILDSVATASGRGYYLVGSDGGVFSFGDARFYGSTGSAALPAPVRTLVPDPDGTGYWLVGFDGSVYAYRATFHGSMRGQKINRPIAGMVAFGNGYLMVASDGGIFNFSNKPFLGSLGAHPPAVPIVAVASYG